MSLVEQVRRRLLDHRQLLSNLAWQGAAQLGARVLNLAIFVLIANALGANGLGQFVFAVTFAQAAGVFVDFGMHPILVREAVRGEAWGLFRTFSRLKLLLSLIVGAVALGVSAFLFGHRGREALGIALGLAAIFGLSYLGLLFSLFRARQEMAYEALFTFLHRLSYFALALAALTAWSTANGVLAAYAASGLLTAIVVQAFAVRRYAQRDSQPVPVDRALLGQILPLLLIDFSTLIYFRVDALLLRVLKGYTEVGVYSAAYRLFEALIIAPSVLAIAFFPRLVKDVTRPARRKNVRTYFMWFVLLGVLGAGLFYALSGPIVHLLYGSREDYAASASIFRLLLVAFVIVCVNYPLTQIAVASGRQREYALGTVVAGLTNIGLNLVAIPRYGAMGAAAVTIATELSLFLFMRGQLKGV
jgi:O-antigen/teichoic acid export membrane protein